MEMETLRPFEEKRKLNTLEKVLKRKMEIYTDISLAVKQELEYNSKFINLKAILGTVTDEDLYNYIVEFLKNTPKYNLAEKYLSISNETIIIEIGTDVTYFVDLDKEKKIFKLTRKSAPYYHFEIEDANFRKIFVHTLIDYFKSMRFLISIKEEPMENPGEEPEEEKENTNQTETPNTGESENDNPVQEETSNNTEDLNKENESSTDTI